MALKVHPNFEDRLQSPVPPDAIGQPSPPSPGFRKLEEAPNKPPPSPSSARQYSEVIEQILNGQNDFYCDRKALVRDCFRFARPLRPGLAALLYAGALVVMGALEFLRAERVKQELGIIFSAFLLAACVPLCFLLLGLRQCRIFQCPQLLISFMNLLPYASAVVSELELSSQELLKVASLQLLSAQLFRSSWQAHGVSFLCCSLLVLALLPLSVEELRLRPPLLEGLVLYLLTGMLALASDDTSSWCAAFRVQKQDVSSWSLHSIFEDFLGTTVGRVDGSSQAVLRQRLMRQLRQMAQQAAHVYELREVDRKQLAQTLQCLCAAVEKSLVEDVPTLDVRDSPLLVQDWVSQNFARSISVESSLKDIREEGGHDVKKAHQKYVGKFQHSSSSRSIVEPIPEAPERAGMNVTEDQHQVEELSYTGVINTMLCALDYLDRQGAPSLVAEETVEVLLAQFGNWDFNVVGLSEVLGSKTLHVMGRKAVVPFLEQISSNHLGGDSDEALDAVLQSVESRYHRSNPYHNSVHASDVVNSLAYFLQQFSNCHQFTCKEVFACLLAAAAHDVGHDGKSGRYHTSTESPLALMYNDSSVLEMMHCSIFFAVIRSQGTKLLNDWEHAERQGFRQQVIRMILDTDLAKHFEQVKKFKEKYLESEHEEELSPEQRQDVLSFMLKLSDIGGSAKPFALHAQWATRIQAEFFLQGDLEREVGLPCSPFCDREVQKVAESQQGFYTYIVKPLYGCLVPFLHSSRLELEVMQNIFQSEAFWGRYDNTRFNYQDPMASTSDLLKQFMYRPNRVSSDPLQEPSSPPQSQQGVRAEQ